MRNRDYERMSAETQEAISSLSELAKEAGVRRVFTYIKRHAKPRDPVTINRLRNENRDIKASTINQYLRLFQHYDVIEGMTLQVEYGWKSKATGKVMEQRVLWIPAYKVRDSYTAKEFSKMVAAF